MKKISIIFSLTLLLILVILVIIKFLEFIKFECFYRAIFNIYCAGCGTTRMLKSIIKLDFYQAFRYNPLMFILLVLLCIYLIYNAILFIKGKPIIKPSIKSLVIIFIILIIYMIFRNIPGFEYLRPTVIN